MRDFLVSYGNYVFETGIFVSVCAVSLYWNNHRTKVVFLDIAKLLGACQLLVIGVRICIEAILKLSCCPEIPERGYLFVGALAVIWNVVGGMKKIILKSNPQ